MQFRGIFGVVLVAGGMLVACSKQVGDPGATGKRAQASAQATSADAIAGSTAGSTKPARFAALPDRGELLHYDAQPARRDGAYTWHRTELSEQHALDAISSGVLRVATPAGALLNFKFDHSIRHEESGDWTWVGHLPGREGVQAILTFGQGAAYGSIGQPDARPLRLTMRGGASWLVETDPTQLVGIASHAANPVSPDYKIVTPEMLQQLRQSGSRMHSAALAAQTASVTAASVPTVDVLIGYTQGFVTAQGSSSNAVTRLNNMVDTANIGLSNSQVNGRIRLVHAMQVNYTDTNTNGVALDELTGYDVDAQKQTTPNAAFNALRAARETYGADLVSLVRPYKDPEQDSCGIAWLVGGSKQGGTVTAGSDWDFFGYSVVSDGTDKNESDGKTYYCEEHTLAHELGHNMGSQHDRDNSKGDDDVLDDPDDYGAFAYSFGYKPAAFYTIMAYGDPNKITSYLVFSNPRINFCGVACGVDNSEDNARSLGNLLPIVAQFRAMVVPLPSVGIHNDLDGDGKSDLLFRYNQDVPSNYSFWIMSGKSKVRNWRETVGAGNSAAATGDFNGDGKADIVWRNSRNQLYIWFGTGTGFSKGNYAGTLQPGWSVVAAGDIDGDGKSDLVIRYNQPVSSNLAFWLMDGTKSKAVTFATVGTGNSLSAVGDFNGDGLLDLVWTNSSLAIYMWLGRGDSTFQGGNKVGTLTSGWSVRGAGDFNGDGMDDLLFGYNKAVSGNLSVWTLHGAVRTGITHYTLGSGNTISSIGDFDGNGRADILFTNSRRQLYMWLGRSTTGFSTGNYAGTLGAGWSVLDPGK